MKYLLAFALLPFVSPAQQPGAVIRQPGGNAPQSPAGAPREAAQPAKPSAIEGRVLNAATGEPVKKGELRSPPHRCDARHDELPENAPDLCVFPGGLRDARLFRITSASRSLLVWSSAARCGSRGILRPISRMCASACVPARPPSCLGRRSNGRVQDDGSFVLSNVSPDHYPLTVLGAPDGCVKSIQMGDEDALDTGLNLMHGPAGAVSVPLRPGAGQAGGVSSMRISSPPRGQPLSWSQAMKGAAARCSFTGTRRPISTGGSL
jgi:hypothetical protein